MQLSSGRSRPTGSTAATARPHREILSSGRAVRPPRRRRSFRTCSRLTSPDWFDTSSNKDPARSGDHRPVSKTRTSGCRCGIPHASRCVESPIVLPRAARHAAWHDGQNRFELEVEVFSARESLRRSEGRVRQLLPRQADWHPEWVLSRCSIEAQMRLARKKLCDGRSDTRTGPKTHGTADSVEYRAAQRSGALNPENRPVV